MKQQNMDLPESVSSRIYDLYATWLQKESTKSLVQK